MVTYSAEGVKALKKKRSKFAGTIIAAAVICIAVCMVLCFMIDRSNAVVMEIAAGVVSVACGWYIIGCAFVVILPVNALIRHINGVISANNCVVNGEVAGVGNKITVERYIIAEQITISDGEGRHIYYWEEILGECPFKEGDKVSLSVGRNFIRAYGEVSDVG